MSEKFDKQHKAKELKDMIQNRKPSESVEEVLIKYCQRHGISVDDCRNYYDKLVKAGKIKENNV
ncbi:MAG: hypothetical protein ABSA79_07310 [Candidatus Bathyarchaeia archaeon]|jgi:predicted solute-binding protein